MTEGRKRDSSFSSTEGYNGDSDITEDCSLEHGTVECENKLGSFTWPSPFFAFATASGTSRRRKQKKNCKDNAAVAGSTKENLEEVTAVSIAQGSMKKNDAAITQHDTDNLEESGRDQTQTIDSDSIETQLKFQQQEPSSQLVERLRCEYFEWCQLHKNDNGLLNSVEFSTTARTHSGENANRTPCKMPVLSCHHVLLEDALSFAKRPRLLLQAKHPYTIVHTNAAYAQMRASVKNVTLPSFKRDKNNDSIKTNDLSTSQNNHNKQRKEVSEEKRRASNGSKSKSSLMAIILDSFCPGERLTLYPVYKEYKCDDQKLQELNHVPNIVSHFLVECYFDEKSGDEQICGTTDDNDEVAHCIDIGTKTTNNCQTPKQVVG